MTNLRWSRSPILPAVTRTAKLTMPCTWVDLPPLNEPRAAGAAAVVGDRIVVAGGQANGALVPTTEVFDGTKWTTVSDIPTPREHLAGVSDGTYFYAIGGRDLASDQNTAAVERFDPAAGTWTTLPAMPTPRGGLGAAFIDGRIVAVGGEQRPGCCRRSRLRRRVGDLVTVAAHAQRGARDVRCDGRTHRLRHRRCTTAHARGVHRDCTGIGFLVSVPVPTGRGSRGHTD